LVPSNHNIRLQIDTRNSGSSSGPVLKENQLPFHPFDTGWIKSIYSVLCLSWFLFDIGLLPQFTLYSFYNNIYIPFSNMAIKVCEFIGNTSLSVSKRFIYFESIAFHRFDYISPIYNGIKYVEQCVPSFDGGRPPSYKYLPSNVCLRKISSGKHLGSYYARKRIHQRHQIISGPSGTFFTGLINM
jgi:hypothetical protein